jgi:hypothetical protein
VISWLTRKLSRDPGQLGLFDVPPLGSALVPRPVQAPRMPAAATPASHDVALEPVSAPVSALASELVRGPVSETCGTPMGSTAGPRPDPTALLAVLQRHGLRGVDRLVLTRNRRTMVSLSGRVLRVHEGFVGAPPSVQSAIAVFATSRNREKRNAARDIVVSYPVPIRPPTRRRLTTHPDDTAMSARLTQLHAQLNFEHFGGALDAMTIQVSRRLLRRLGQYTMREYNGGRGEIVLSRRHVRRDGWAEAIETLLHEMVHQWQDETGRPVDHGAGFRAKCVEVGISPAATRMMVR